MMKRTQVQTVVLMAVGALLGYAAAVGRLTEPRRAQAASQPSESPAIGEPEPTCCSEGPGKGLLLAKADQNEARPQGNGQPASDGTKPNILVIWGDDIGISNISAYSNGLMGYTTPNIDRIAKEGIRFLHYYGEQSCTAGRAAFLTGQHGTADDTSTATVSTSMA
jgi:Sulfatase